ncbi:MAG: type II secretion system ATPase GspE, partial [Pseudomonadota bacterium]|nr:type II secretion system ATPase GspE [Pseudomonadota bacterium]
QIGEPQDLLEAAESAPVVRLINAILAEAIREGASDIHLEPYEQRLAVRFRVDGVLREVLAPNRTLAGLLTSRIKVMAKLDIAEKRLPQDGRISVQVAGRAVDLRVSTIPSAHGERVVLRLLDKQAGRLDLAQLGFSEEMARSIEALVHRAHGILLVTGPTGSGKTTTLYAMLSRLNDLSRNIMTVEDPIEYYIDGIAQTQVNPRIDLSFARGLRAILRQDPDVVMVGEIRDLETAQIAVQASLTGHLVLSTLHTNSAVGAVTRLRDMGIESFLLSSSLLGVLAQRLVRTLCRTCREPYAADAVTAARLGLREVPDARLFRAVGCDQCGGTGYRGRAGIFELFQVSDTVRTLIHDGADDQTLAGAAPARRSLFADGRSRVLRGDTTIEELLRVTQHD